MSAYPFHPEAFVALENERMGQLFALRDGHHDLILNDRELGGVDCYAVSRGLAGSGDRRLLYASKPGLHHGR